MASEIAETAATALERTINQFGGKEDADHIVNHLTSMHPTLQQSFVSRIIIPLVREMAMHHSDRWYDARNETACKVCRVMYDALKAEYGRVGDDETIALPMM
jgi:hypothetical protein